MLPLASLVAVFPLQGHPQLWVFSEQLHYGKSLCWLLRAYRDESEDTPPCPTFREPGIREPRVCMADGKPWPQCPFFSGCPLPRAEHKRRMSGQDAVLTTSPFSSGALDFRTCPGLGGRDPGFQRCQMTPCSVPASVK